MFHATRDLPAEAVSVLETLYGVKTVEEIAERMAWADELFEKAVTEAETLISASFSS
ncbi:hypothetical protein [Paenibacillus humicola]|uniref:hypothetical protein n=1 Tax=Paenibacillus humicola TaxID=3110540 RepID=UPI00237ABB4E|nr:hypothetical protein [Paenibacillus humicola]